MITANCREEENVEMLLGFFYPTAWHSSSAARGGCKFRKFISGKMSDFATAHAVKFKT